MALSDFTLVRGNRHGLDIEVWRPGVDMLALLILLLIIFGGIGIWAYFWLKRNYGHTSIFKRLFGKERD